MVKSYLKAIIAIVVLFFVVTFAVKNYAPVQLSYYFGLFNASLPLYAVIYIAFFLGGLIGIFVGLAWRQGVKKELKLKTKENKELRSELDALQAKTAVPVYTENVYVPVAQPGSASAEVEKPQPGMEDMYK